MGIGSSRKWSAYHPDKPQSFRQHSSPHRRKHRPSIFRRSRSITTATLIPIPTMVQPMARRALYGSYSAMRPIPATYTPMQQMAPSFMPMHYNNYSTPSYIAPQSMMIQQQRAAPSMPAQYMALPAPSMPSPYMQQPQIQQPQIQQPQMQIAYNSAPIPSSIPASMSGGTGSYPLSYPSQPGRLITDWTGGGKISPGFLGPPI